MKTIVMSATAARQFDDLPRSAQDQVASGLHLYALSGTGDIKRLQGRDGFRLRVGRYRVVFDETLTTILALQIGKRETTTYR